MKIYFSLRKTLTGAILIVVCLLMSRWQWHRYLEKIAYSEELSERLRRPVEPFDPVATNPATEWDQQIHRRFQVVGTYDFSKETILRNRKFEDEPGFFVITPLHLSDGKTTVLVNRGFIPYDASSHDQRSKFQQDAAASFIGLVKHSMSGWQAFGVPLGPQDDTPSPAGPWLDAWLRIEIPKMQMQIPYPVLPIYLEIVDTLDPATQAYKFFETKSGRDDMMSLATREVKISGNGKDPDRHYPIPVFDTVVPAGRHYGYVWQWLFIGLLVGLVTLMVQLKPDRQYRAEAR